MNNDSLVEHLSEHFSESDTKNFDVLDFVGAFGSPLLALAYSKLIWPDFSTYKDMIFLSEFLDDECKGRIDLMLEEGSSAKQIEESFNFFEVPSSFFGRNAGDTVVEEDLQLARVLSETWSAKLARDFPSLDFRVLVLNDPEETGGEIGIQFFRVH
ncbi:MAG TPA: hypothetical protein VMM38_16205 [Aridibacter sp.]|nr:hypothetical protein [Aridibacter sp.]